MITLSSAGDLANTANATSALAAVDLATAATNTALGELAADARALDFQTRFLAALSDATEEGLGSIVDADLAKESARLQALQVKQRLSVTSLGIANAAPQSLLALFQ